jgi:hypothetical protein
MGTSAATADNTKKGERYHESALISAAHILVCLTQEGKSIEEIAADDWVFRVSAYTLCFFLKQ